MTFLTLLWHHPFQRNAKNCVGTKTLKIQAGYVVEATQWKIFDQVMQNTHESETASKLNDSICYIIAFIVALMCIDSIDLGGLPINRDGEEAKLWKEMNIKIK